MILVRLVRRIAYWLRSRSRQDELREELELHRELLAEDLQRRGLFPRRKTRRSRCVTAARPRMPVRLWPHRSRPAALPVHSVSA